MNEKLIVELANLPEEGMAIAGVLDPKIFSLPDKDARAVGGLEYDLWVQRFDDEVLFCGHIGAPFEFMCVRTNKWFVQTIYLDESAVSIEVTGGIVDATEAIREDVLINIPSYPKCDEGDEPEECALDERYLALDKPVEVEVNEAPLNEGDDCWSVLDGINQFKDNK